MCPLLSFRCDEPLFSSLSLSCTDIVSKRNFPYVRLDKVYLSETFKEFHPSRGSFPLFSIRELIFVHHYRLLKLKGICWIANLLKSLLKYACVNLNDVYVLGVFHVMYVTIKKTF